MSIPLKLEVPSELTEGTINLFIHWKLNILCLKCSMTSPPCLCPVLFSYFSVLKAFALLYVLCQHHIIAKYNKRHFTNNNTNYFSWKQPQQHFSPFPSKSKHDAVNIMHTYTYPQQFNNPPALSQSFNKPHSNRRGSLGLLL